MRDFVNLDEPGSESDDSDNDTPAPLELEGFGFDIARTIRENNFVLMGPGDTSEDSTDTESDENGSFEYTDEPDPVSPPTAEAETPPDEAGPAPSEGRQTRQALKRKAPAMDDTGSDSSSMSDSDESDNEESGTHASGLDEEEDDVVKAIIANTRTTRVHPPDIATDEFVVDLSFHPDADILAVGTLGGDVLIYKYSNEENTLVTTLEMHTKAIRDIEFNDDGSTLFSASKDKSIVLSDVHTGKLKRLYEDAHTAPVYRMNVIDEQLFASGNYSI